MVLPTLDKCCWKVSLRKGCILLILLSTVFSVTTVSLAAAKLPRHTERRNEDNLMLMIIVMFATLSTLSNLGGLLGVIMKRPTYVQLAQLSNSVFLLCLFVIGVVSCLFSPGLKPYFELPQNLVIHIFMIIIGALYAIYYMTILSSMYTKMKSIHVFRDPVTDHLSHKIHE